MSKSEWILTKRLLILFALLHLAIIVLVILPRKHTRSIRHFIKEYFVIPAWNGVSRLFAIGSDVMWQEGNGHRYKD